MEYVKQLKDSKWTKANPCKQEKHFIVVHSIKKKDGSIAVELEAIYTRQHYVVAGDDLKDKEKWRRGWH